MRKYKNVRWHIDRASDRKYGTLPLRLRFGARGVARSIDIGLKKIPLRSVAAEFQFVRIVIESM